MSEFDYLMGWVNDQDGIRRIAATMPYPVFAQAASHLMGDGTDKDIFLYIAWKDVLNDYPDYVAQAIGDCFPAGTKVTMSDCTEKNIEDINIGEIVLSHRNVPRMVTRTIAKPYSGDLVGIEAKGYARKLWSTPDHKIAHFPGISTAKKMRNKKKRNLNQQWTPIDLLDENSRVLVPWCQHFEPETEPTLDVTSMVRNPVILDDKIRVKGSARTSNRFIKVDQTFCWLIGLYLAEGGITNGPTGEPCRVDFNLGGDEFFEAINAIAAIEHVFGAEAKIARVPSKPNVLYVRCSNAAVASIFKKLVPGNLYKKSIPNIIFKTTKLCRLACLRGWLHGDGMQSIGTSFRINGIGSSHDLLHDMFRIATTNKLRPKLHQRKQYAHQTVAAKSIDFYGESALSIMPEYTEEVQSICKIKFGQNRIDNTNYGLALPIRRPIHKLVKNINVFCLEVEEDSSFIANGYGVHNCTSFGTGHAIDLLQCVQIAIGKQAQAFKETCTEALYGDGRKIANMLGGGDGCYGSALAKASTENGVVPREAVGAYSGQRAKQWGSSGTPSDVNTKAADHKVKTTSMVSTWEELCAALANGYPVTVCSNQGFTMVRDSNGVCTPKGNWGHCLLADSLVSTIVPKLAKEVVEGDEVYTHRGRSKKVTKVNRRWYDGKLISIKTACCAVSRTTSEHPYFIKRNKIFKWVPASKIFLGDELVVPKINFSERKTKVPNWPKSKKARNIPKSIDHKDPDINFLFGFYIADGNVVKNHRITLTLKAGSIHTDRLQKAISKLGLVGRKVEHGNYDRLHVDSSILARAFVKWFGGYSHSKHIPDFMFTKGWDIRSLIDGYAAGDGCWLKGRNRQRITSVSSSLAYQIWLITISLDLYPSMYCIQADRPGCYANSSPSIAVEFGEAQKHKFCKYYDNFYCLPVREINSIDVCTHVYNFEIEDDNSFIANGFAMHNCMMISGVRNSTNHALICQSWGSNVPSGPLANDQPNFSFWAPRNTVSAMLSLQDSWAFSSFDGYPGQPLPSHWTHEGWSGF